MLKKFLLQGKMKNYKRLLIGCGSTVGVDKNPMHVEFEQALEDIADLKQIIKQDELNEVINEHSILSMNTDSSV